MGAVSIDIVKKGCGKGQIAKELKQIAPDKKLFSLEIEFLKGNDYELACALKQYSNTQVVQVETLEDVLKF